MEIHESRKHHSVVPVSQNYWLNSTTTVNFTFTHYRSALIKLYTLDFSQINRAVRQCLFCLADEALQPWWSDELWALCYQLRRAYQAMVSFSSVENSGSYSLHKANYQRRPRQRITESWKEFCTNNFNGDLFRAIRRVADPAANQCSPPLIKINGAPVLDPSEKPLATLSSLKPFQTQYHNSILDLKDIQPTRPNWLIRANLSRQR